MTDDLTFEVFNKPEETEQWFDVAFISDPLDPELMKKELEVVGTAPDIKKGIPFCARLEGKIIGTAYVQTTVFDSPGTSATLFHMAIKKELQGKGLGKNFLSWIEDNLKGQGLSVLILFTSMASGFYEKCGYKKWGTLNLEDKDKIDRLYYYKKLT